MASQHSGDDKNLFCSFCGKSQRDVKQLISGPSVYICNECISLCNDIIAEEHLDDDDKDNTDVSLLKPAQI